MLASSPEAVHTLWLDGVNRGDLDGLLALYEPDTAYVVRPGETVVGEVAVREAIVGLLALQPSVTLEPVFVVRTGDLALLISRWHLTGTGSDGTPVDVGGQTGDVVRQQGDGTWRYAIDNPWGESAAGT